ncbi:hypothetical protein Tco_0509338 [Tanacetum coccineum]
MQLHHLVELVGSISLSPSNDRWAWLLGSSGEFSVHSGFRTFIDDILLPFVSEILGFPSISHVPVSGPKWPPCLARVRSNRVRADVSSLPRMFLGPRKVLLDSGSGTPQLPRLLVLPRRLCSFVSWLPLSIFLVDMLRYYRIHISQLSVIAAAKVSHFEILCRVHNCEPTVGLFRCFYVNSKNKGWMSFISVGVMTLSVITTTSRFLKASNDQFFWVLTTLLGPASFHGTGEMDLLSFVRTASYEAKDHGILVGTSVAGKSMPAIQLSLTGAVQNAAVRSEPVPSLPFVTSSVSTMPEHEDERHTDTLAGANLQTVTAPQRFVIFSDSSHHSGTHIAETEADSLIRSSAPAMTTATTVTVTAGATTVVKETVVKPSWFATGSSSVGGTKPLLGGFSDLIGSDFLVGDIRTVIDPGSDLKKVYVP